MAKGRANGEQKSASWSLGSVHPCGIAMVDCSLVGVALVELFVLAHRASWDLLSLVLLPAVLESSAVLLFFVRASSRHGSAAGLAACATVRHLHAVCGWNCTVPCSSRAGCCLKISCVPIKGACESCTALDLHPCRDFCE